MTDDELLVVAAQLASLTPEAATELRKELARRGLTETDVKEASEKIRKLNVEDQKIRGALFDPRRRLESALRSFIAFVLVVAWWVISLPLAGALFKSPHTQMKFRTSICFFIAIADVAWEIAVYKKGRRSRRAKTTAR